MKFSPVGLEDTAARGSHELKFIFPNTMTSTVSDWVGHCLVGDPAYPAAIVSTLYFDTPTLRHWDEKRNSDFLKLKLRLRWYETGRGTSPGDVVSCWFERKSKTGASRSKDRVSQPVDAATLGDPFVRAVELSRLPALLPYANRSAQERLAPVLLIRYRRQRYFDPHSQSRVAVDSDIECSCDRAARWAVHESVRLDVGVLEIKGSSRHLPLQLQAIGDHMARNSFSKYARCIEQLAQPLARRN